MAGTACSGEWSSRFDGRFMGEFLGLTARPKGVILGKVLKSLLRYLVLLKDPLEKTWHFLLF
jgi:hypothetical protein